MGQHEAVPAEDLAVGRVARVGRTAGGGEHRRRVEHSEAVRVERRLLGTVETPVKQASRPPHPADEHVAHLPARGRRRPSARRRQR